MPQSFGHEHITLDLSSFMNQLILDSRPPGFQKNQLVPVNEQEKTEIKLVSRQSICAMDVMGLSWIFQTEEELLESFK
ncbi:MAG: hypothetical protein OEM21_09700 [Nitrosopumilus sp.]|nr:hypothetical protein [Nitrosopumilus sp.]